MLRRFACPGTAAPSRPPPRPAVQQGIDDHDAHAVASQGQQRAIVLALKLAELDYLRARLGSAPILLLDDVSSELDPTRIGAVHAFLRDSQSQVFVTTTRSDLFQTPGATSLVARAAPSAPPATSLLWPHLSAE